MNVLVVEDIPDVALTFAALIRAYGHRTQVAYDGESAIRMAREFRPQTVFIDIVLPGIDGYELAEKLRSLEGLERAYMVSVSGNDPESDRFRQAGLDLHLKKPVSIDGLLSALHPEAHQGATR